MSLLALAVLAISNAQASSGPAPDVVVIKDARIVVKPGRVIEKGSLIIHDGRITSVGDAPANLPAGARIIDANGLTAYAGFVNAQFSGRVDGVTPTAIPRGTTLPASEQAQLQRRRDDDPFNREGNLLLGRNLSSANEIESSGLESLAKSGFSLVAFTASGGLIGSETRVYPTGQEKIKGDAGTTAPLVSFRVAARGAGGYPGSMMGTIAFTRQALIDAQQTKPGEELGIRRLAELLEGKRTAVFEDLTESTFWPAYHLSQEFKIKPIFSFRSSAGAVIDVVKQTGGSVLLRGSIPTKPTIGSDLSRASISGIRSYFNEVQAGAELERSGIPFAYAPLSTTNPLEGIRTYVAGGLSRDAALTALTVQPAQLLGLTDTGTLEVGKRGNVTLFQGDAFDSSSQVMITLVDGKNVTGEMPARKTADQIKATPSLAVAKPNYNRFPVPAESVSAFRLYRNATVWTMGPQGVLGEADVLIRDGKIQGVGKNLTAPAGCEIIDATGLHISPGIWDCHSHTAIMGGVNEGNNMITAETRIRDVMDPTDWTIYQQLSGGTVGANQLHGSANAIGGQNNVVKWRWGKKNPEDFRVEGAPEGVKFALGQNPIREDSGGFGNQAPVGGTLLTFRPRTRMGVEDAIRRALQLGLEYNQAWADYRAGKRDQPRRDLQLEALGEIVAGERWIHSHGYRADEMLTLIRIIQKYGGRLATLQHVLEGYKIADEMAEAGVGGSTFADWWGYKLEAYDAIPYNGALMAQRGVSVSINSDSDDHGRRLNIEAAKSMRYGGVSAEKALSFVTIEPARQLGIDNRTGSLEVGKDADLAIWSTNPLSIEAICYQTYVDGIKLFDRENDLAQRAAREQELLEAKRLLSDQPEDSPFRTGEIAANNQDLSPTTAKFGLESLDTEPATIRYPRTPVLITGATLHPMVGAPITGDILIGANGKIAAVGGSINAPANAVRVDGRGKHVYPGLIDPVTGIGLNEIGQVPASDDSSERGTFHPDYRVERVINPEWETMGVARHQGILTVLVKPSGSGIPGQAALIHTEGYTWEDLCIKGGFAMVYTLSGGGARFGSTRFDDSQTDDGHGHSHGRADRHVFHEEDDHTSGRAEQPQENPTSGMDSLTRQLNEAREYAGRRAKATPTDPVPRDLRYEALLTVAEGKMPILVAANSAADIRSVVTWAEQQNVRILIYGGTGAGEIADWLAAKKVPIILSGVFNMPSEDQPVDYYYRLPATLAKAGVKFGLSMVDDKDTRQLRDMAGWAATYGMDREDAVRAMTLWTAEILGLSQRMGALVPQMDGTIILTDGEITEIKTQVLRAWINGREVPLTNRQTRLYEKYRDRPVRAGQTLP